MVSLSVKRRCGRSDRLAARGRLPILSISHRLGVEAKMMVLDTERDYFESHRVALLHDHKGQFVLVKGAKLIDAFPDAESAYMKGLEIFGIQPFLVKKVEEREPVGFAPMMSLVADAGL
jgi:hypothetical protein